MYNICKILVQLKNFQLKE